MKLILHPTCFPNIAHGVCLVQSKIQWEQWDNFQKQTLRNRYYIATDQGAHTLTIPIKHTGSKTGRQRYHEVKIDNSYPWQKQHFKTLETAYRTSPYFEFYEDELKELFYETFEQLFDFNCKTIEFILRQLSLKQDMEFTQNYDALAESAKLGRHLVLAKKGILYHPNPYYQVFGDRHGFIPNLSMLDLLFNEGPNSLSYLKEQTTPIFL